MLEPGPPFEAFLRTVVLGSHVARLPEGARAGFVREVASQLPEPRIDYVRLNIAARRGQALALNRVAHTSRAAKHPPRS